MTASSGGNSRGRRSGAAAPKRCGTNAPSLPDSPLPEGRGTAHLVRGQQAEDFALSHLESRGLRLLARNVRCRSGELDLVMCDGHNLVVVEVRSRASATLARPADTVTAGKRRRILRATEYLLLREPRLREWPVRFDIVEVIGDGPRPALAWLRAAFSGDDVAGT